MKANSSDKMLDRSIKQHQDLVLKYADLQQRYDKLEKAFEELIRNIASQAPIKQRPEVLEYWRTKAGLSPTTDKAEG